MNLPQPDIAVRSRSGSNLAIVEVKNIPRLSQSDAEQLRDAVLSSRAEGDSFKYFLLLSQEIGFIWQLSHLPNQSVPSERFNLKPVLSEYLTDAELEQHLRGTELELMFAHWLGDLARGRGVQPKVSNNGTFQRFVSDLRGGQIHLGAAA